MTHEEQALEAARDRYFIQILHEAAERSATQQATIILNLKDNYLHLADGAIHRVCTYQEVAWKIVVDDRLKAVTIFTTQPHCRPMPLPDMDRIKRFYFAPREWAGSVIPMVRID